MSEELWYVKLANGDVHRVTLDQLDGAFQAGHIDEGTLVLAAGATQWTKLGELLGLDDEEAASAAPASAPEPVAAAAPSHAAREPEPAYIPAAPLPAYATAPQPRAHLAPAPARTVAPAPMPSHAAPVQTYAAPRAVVARSIAPAYAVNSLRPMSMDLGDAADYDMPFQRRSKKGWAVAVLGLLVVAGGVGMASNRGLIRLPNLGGSSGSDLATVAAAAAAAPPPAADPVVADPAPVAAAPTPPPAPLSATPATPAPNAAPSDGSPLNPTFTTRFNEDTKQKLVSADKTRAQKSKARHASSGGASHGAKPKSSGVFTTGGNKYDPLNSSI